jgi:predicted small lipoprotein YifL
VHRRTHPLRPIAAAVVLMAAGLALAACGRKGALDPPPSAALNPAAATARPSLGEENENLAASQFGAPPPARRQAVPPAPAAPPRPFFLDFLIGK